MDHLSNSQKKSLGLNINFFKEVSEWLQQRRVIGFPLGRLIALEKKYHWLSAPLLVIDMVYMQVIQSVPLVAKAEEQETPKERSWLVRQGEGKPCQVLCCNKMVNSATKTEFHCILEKCQVLVPGALPCTLPSAPHLSVSNCCLWSYT